MPMQEAKRIQVRQNYMLVEDQDIDGAAATPTKSVVVPMGVDKKTPEE